MRVWRCAGRRLNVFERPHIMGILNVTPDSFSDGGLHYAREAAIARAIQMVEEGADIIDVGGESTRPGAEPVREEEELDRVVPVISAIAGRIDVAVSVDTTKAAVAEAALGAGAVIVNDVSAMRHDPAMAKVVEASGAGVVLMHMLGDPRTMQSEPHYLDVVGDVRGALLEWTAGATRAGIPPECIAIDPGIGFGKTAQHNLLLLKSMRLFADCGYPLMVGPSRKSFIGLTLNLRVEERVEGTAAVVAWCIAGGANIVRVHDIAPMSRVVRMVQAIKEAGG